MGCFLGCVLQSLGGCLFDCNGVIEMTNEEKQVLIDYCKEEVRLKTEHIARLEKHMPGQFDLTRYQMELQTAEIALAALTAPAINLAELVPDEIIGCVAALAAAISLLEKGGKKAAASDIMFDQMLDDYRKALESVRAILRNIEEAQNQAKS